MGSEKQRETGTRVQELTRLYWASWDQGLTRVPGSPPPLARFWFVCRSRQLLCSLSRLF